MKPRWIESERFERVGSFVVGAAKAVVFPLLCPVREYEWLPGWSCAMMYSDSGVAEKNAIFMTREKLRRKVMWTTITYQPNSLIEFLLVMGSEAVIRFSIGLEDSPEQATRTVWRMLFTATGRFARHLLPRNFSEKKFQAMLAAREKELNDFLRLPRQ